MTATVNNLYTMLLAEMVRVDTMRVKLNMNQPPDVLNEFLWRRLLLHGQHATNQRDNDKAERMWKALFQIGRGGNECPR